MIAARKALLIIALLASTASTASAKGKVQYDVCAIEGGKLSVYEVTPDRKEALFLAKYIGRKTHVHYFVVVDEGDDK